MSESDSCPSLEELERLASGALEREPAAALEAHIESCSECTTRREETARNVGLLARLRRCIDTRTPEARLTIDGFRIDGELGRGGMGVVYRAEQLNPRRSVALKVVRGSSFADQRARGLFEREIQALARLSHPTIAQIYGAGLTETGEPYFAMELIEGEPLNRAARRLDLRGKLALLAHVARGVHHAHQRGVIHRDLKPSNVLVDATGRARILDFGLAKLLDDERPDAARSVAGSIRGTLAYMAPEQTRGDPDAIDARADVHALGILLFELVAGRPPYSVPSGNLLEAVRVICETPIPRPSRYEPRARGDIDAITLTALEKDPNRRYASAAALAEDLERFLRGDVVAARAPSGWYVLRKLATRHKLAATLAGALMLSAIGFGAWMSVLYARADVLRELAQTSERISEQRRVVAEEQSDIAEAARREALTNLERSRIETVRSEWLLEFLLASVRSAISVGREAKLSDLVERLTVGVDQQQSQQPALAAALGITIAGLEEALGEFERARQRAERGLELSRRSESQDPSFEARGRAVLARVAISQHRCDDAERELAAAYAALELAAEPDSSNAHLQLDAIEADRLARCGQRESAIALYLRIHGAWKLRTDELSQDRVALAENLGNLLAAEGRHDEARLFHDEALEGTRRLFGSESRAALHAAMSRATLFYDQREFATARDLFEATLAAQVRTLGSSDPDALATASSLIATRVALGDVEGACADSKTLLAAQEQALGAHHEQTLNSLCNTSVMLLRLGRADEALPLCSQAVSRAEANYPPWSEAVVRGRNVYATVLGALSRFEEAEAELLATWSTLETPEASSTLRRETALTAASFYRSWKKPSETALWRERAR